VTQRYELMDRILQLSMGLRDNRQFTPSPPSDRGILEETQAYDPLRAGTVEIGAATQFLRGVVRGGGPNQDIQKGRRRPLF